MQFDNTIRSAFVVCPTQYRYAYVEDLSPIGESVHLHAGAAFADGLETTRRAFYEAGEPADMAVVKGQARVREQYGDFQPPQGSPKTAENMAAALAYYFESWPLEHDTYRPKRMEWRFKVPIPDLVHPDHGGPIYYTGRPDTMGDISGVPAIEDDKTATSLGASWGKQWELDSQFTGYQWAAQELGELPKGGTGAVLIRGISILKPKFVEVEDPEGDIYKMVGRGKARTEQRFRLQYDRAASFGHDQVLVYRPRWMIDRWLEQLKRDVRRMIYAYLNGVWDMALHKNACAAYGGCSYALLCGSEHPEQWKEINFTRRKWDPLSVI